MLCHQYMHGIMPQTVYMGEESASILTVPIHADCVLHETLTACKQLFFFFFFFFKLEESQQIEGKDAF